LLFTFKLVLVVTTAKEPVIGFSDTILGILGVGLGVCMGLIRVFKASPNTILNMVASDVVVNYILVIAWNTAKRKTDNEPKIYTCCAPNHDQKSISKFERLTRL
jgi:hypothetical protein